MKDRIWRLNNLYWIINKQGEEVKFKLNIFQEFLIKRLWFLVIVLKARQLGITTFFCILYLDDTLFTENLSAAIIADTVQHAKEIFETKIRFPFEKLPDWLRKDYILDTDTKQSLKFKNINSSISVVTSARSGTYQRLHISEFGKICSKYPEKAKEIRTGSLNTVHAGGLISIESTAEGAFGFFYEMCMQAMKLQEEGSELSELDYKFFFFPWYEDKANVLIGNFIIPSELVEYFEELEQKLGITLSQEQKNWYFKKLQTQKDDMKREYPSTPEEAFAAAIEGAYYGKYVQKAQQEKRLKYRVPHDPLLPVHTWWDLGMNDSNVIIFVQIFNREIRIIDYYANSGEGLAHYARILEEKGSKEGYRYGQHIAPHDIKVRELGTGKSRLETAMTLGINFVIAPMLSIADGIDAVRNVFNRFFVDAEKCENLITSMGTYRKGWDENTNQFKDEPVHDQASHDMDAVRTGVVGMMEILNVSQASSEGSYSERKDVIAEKVGSAYNQDSDNFDQFGI